MFWSLDHFEIDEILEIVAISVPNFNNRDMASAYLALSGSLARYCDNNE